MTAISIGPVRYGRTTRDSAWPLDSFWFLSYDGDFNHDTIGRHFAEAGLRGNTRWKLWRRGGSCTATSGSAAFFGEWQYNCQGRSVFRDVGVAVVLPSLNYRRFLGGGSTTATPTSSYFEELIGPVQLPPQPVQGCRAR